MRDPRAAWFCRSPTARQSYCHAETHRRFNHYCPRAKPFRASNRNPAINHSTINVGAIPIRKVRFAVSSPTRNEAKEILVYAQKRLDLKSYGKDVRWTNNHSLKPGTSTIGSICIYWTASKPRF